MCSQELDILDSRNASPERWPEEDDCAVEDEDEDADGEDDEESKADGSSQDAAVDADFE